MWVRLGLIKMDGESLQYDASLRVHLEAESFDTN